MSHTGSVTEWITELKAGDATAGHNLWQKYIDRLVRPARRTIGSRLRRCVDAEDIALSAFAAFFRGCEDARFPQLDDRDDQWQVLVMLTVRHVTDHLRKELAAKRGGATTRGDCDRPARWCAESELSGLSQVVDGQPTPDFSAACAEEFQALLTSLGDETLRQTALAKIEGNSNLDVARQLGLSIRSVERKLRLIRTAWQQRADCD